MKKSEAMQSTHLPPHVPKMRHHYTTSGTMCNCSCTGGHPQHEALIYNPTSINELSPCHGRGQGGHDDQPLLEQLSADTTGKLAISVPEMAKLLSISKPTAYALARSEGFPAFQVGGRTLVSVPGLMAWVQRASTEEVL